jgi:hypothetical protein
MRAAELAIEEKGGLAAEGSEELINSHSQLVPDGFEWALLRRS